MSDDHMYPERNRTSGTDINAHHPVAGNPPRLQTRGSNQEYPRQPPRGSTAVFTELPQLNSETSRSLREIRNLSHEVPVNCMPEIVMQIRNRNRAEDDVLPLTVPATDGPNSPMDGEFPNIKNS